MKTNETPNTFATAGGTATFVDSRAVSVERVVRGCHFDAPDNEAELVAWIATSPEPGAIWESRTRYGHGVAVGLPVFRVKVVAANHDTSDHPGGCNACRDIDRGTLSPEHNRGHFACSSSPDWLLALEDSGDASCDYVDGSWTWTIFSPVSDGFVQPAGPAAPPVFDTLTVPPAVRPETIEVEPGVFRPIGEDGCAYGPTIELISN